MNIKKIILVIILVFISYQNSNAGFLEDPNNDSVQDLQLWLDASSWVSTSSDWWKVSWWNDKSGNWYHLDDEWPFKVLWVPITSRPRWYSSTHSNSINYKPVVYFFQDDFLDFHNNFKNSFNWRWDYTVIWAINNTTFWKWTFVETVTHESPNAGNWFQNIYNSYTNWKYQAIDNSVINVEAITTNSDFVVSWWDIPFKAAEVLVYNRLLTIEEIEIIESYLALKYWIALEWHNYYDSQHNSLSSTMFNFSPISESYSNYYTYWKYVSQNRYFKYNTIWLIRDDSLWLYVNKSYYQNHWYWLLKAEKSSLLNNEKILISDTWYPVWWDVFDSPPWYSLSWRRWSTQWNWQSTGTIDNIKLTFWVDNPLLDIPAPVSWNNYYFVYDSNLDGFLSDELPIPMVDEWLWNFSISWLSLADRQDFTIWTLWEIDSAPIKINLSSYITNESTASGTTISFLTAEDYNSLDEFTFTLTNWTWSEDNQLFLIDWNELKLNFLPDYENPTDDNNDNRYKIRVRVTDSSSLFYEEELTIFINNINETWINPPSDININWFSYKYIDENISTWTIIGTLNTIDPDIGDFHTYSLSPWWWAQDNSLFSLENGNLIILFSPDYENPEDTWENNIYNIKIRSTDKDWLIKDKVFYIYVKNLLEILNEAPVDVSLNWEYNINIQENLSIWSSISTILATDPNILDSHTFSLISWTWSEDNSLFSISWSLLSITFSPNYESPIDANSDNIYNIRIKATDLWWLTFEKEITVNIQDVVETNSNSPTDIKINWLDIIFVNEWTSPTLTITSLDADIWDTHTYSLVEWLWWEDNSKVILEWNTVRLNFIPDFESPIDNDTNNSYNFRIKATDNWWNNYEKQLSIIINDIADTVISSWWGWGGGWGWWGWGGGWWGSFSITKNCEISEIQCLLVPWSNSLYKIYKKEGVSCKFDQLWDICDPSIFSNSMIIDDSSSSWTIDWEVIDSDIEKSISRYIPNNDKIKIIALRLDKIINSKNKTNDYNTIFSRNVLVVNIEKYVDAIIKKDKDLVNDSKRKIIESYKRFQWELNKLQIENPKKENEKIIDNNANSIWEVQKISTVEKYIPTLEIINKIAIKLDWIINNAWKDDSAEMMKIRNMLLIQLTSYIKTLKSDEKNNVKNIKLKILKNNLTKTVKLFVTELKK